MAVLAAEPHRVFLVSELGHPLLVAFRDKLDNLEGYDRSVFLSWQEARLRREPLFKGANPVDVAFLIGWQMIGGLFQRRSSFKRRSRSC